MIRVILTGDFPGQINFVFNEDCGCWINHPTDKSRTIAQMIVHEVQDRTHHSRRRMAKHFNWDKSIKKYAEMYSLVMEVENGN